MDPSETPQRHQERAQLACLPACHPPCQSEPSPSAERGGRHPWRPGSHSSGGGPSPPAAPVPVRGGGPWISLGHAKGGRYALFSAGSVLFCKLHSARPYLGGVSAPPTPPIAHAAGEGPLGSDWQGGWQASCARSKGGEIKFRWW